MCITRENPYVAVAKFHGGMGNVKIGKVLTVNLVAGDDDLNGRIANIIGSCLNCCICCKPYCYARDYRYDGVVMAHADNTYYAKTDPDGFFKDLEEWLSHKKYDLFRPHSAGENPSYDYMKRMFDMSGRIRQKSYMYTKRFEWLNKYTEENGKPVMKVLMSVPFDCRTLDDVLTWAKENNPYHYGMFICDRHEDERISKIPHCPAVDYYGKKTGVTCSECQRCAKGLTTAVHEHGTRRMNPIKKGGE